MVIKLKQWLRIALVVVGVVFLGVMPQPFPAHLAKVDFQAYWGASYLLAHSENFSDPVRLFEIQEQLAGWDEETPQMTWNPPWLLVLLLPLTLLTFDRASWIWFLINITLVFTSTVLLWDLYASQPETRRRIGLGFLMAFAFIPTLTALLIGQVSTLVLFGLAGFLYYERRQQPFHAGVALALTTIKPHLVYITVPLILLEMARQRRWRTVIGFLAPLLLGVLITFLLRPTFLTEYFSTVGGGGLLYRTVPTLGFFLSRITGWPAIRLMGVVILPLLIVWWWRRGRQSSLNLPDLVASTLLLSLISAPFGWSFDVIIFLVPLLQLLLWMIEGKIAQHRSLAILLLFVAANGVTLYQRSLQLRDDYFFWFPIVMACLYWWGWLSLRESSLRVQGKVISRPYG
jgi:hypothetical protein